MDAMGITFTVVLIVAAVLVGLYFLGRKLQKKSDESQKMIDQNRQTVPAFVIDKKKMKLSEANVPKGSIEKVPFYLKYRKLPMAKVKVGPQIVTMLCDGKVFKNLPVKRNMKLEISGAYILGFSTAKKGEKRPEPPKKLTWREKMAAKAKGLKKKAQPETNKKAVKK